LQTEDLTDFYLPRDHKILPSNTIKNLLSFAGNYQLVKNTFKGIGSCDIILLSRLNDFEKLAQYYYGISLTAIIKMVIVARDLLIFL
jgi:hypothetical protein